MNDICFAFSSYGRSDFFAASLIGQRLQALFVISALSFWSSHSVYGNCNAKFPKIAQKDLRFFAVYPIELHFQCLIAAANYTRRTSCEFSRKITLRRPFPCLPNQYPSHEGKCREPCL